MTRTLLIDGGQSGCRAALVADGRVLATATGPGLPRAGRRYDGLAELIAQDADRVAAGLTGFDGDAAAVAGVFPVPLLVTNDAVTAYLGALGDVAGAVIVAGTGAIALAASAGRHARADGWGPLLGDDGAGHWIGRRGLALALRARDGRGGSRALLDAAEERYGADLKRAVYDSPDPVATVAAFAPAVAAAARAGDERAGAIWAEAGRELARTVAAALREVGGSAVPVSWSGGLFAAGDLLLDPFRAELAQLCPEAEVRPPLGTALDGAARLLERPSRFASAIEEVS